MTLRFRRFLSHTIRSKLPLGEISMDLTTIGGRSWKSASASSW